MALVYVDDMLLSGNYPAMIASTKASLDRDFTIKDLESARYFLGIEIARSKVGIRLNQRKYVIDTLTNAGMLDCKASSFHMQKNLQLQPNVGEVLANPESYRSLVGRLLYLTLSRPDISFTIQQLSQFISIPRQPHMQATLFLRGSLVSWKFKKQKTMSKSMAESEYRSMSYTTSELVWLEGLLGDFNVHVRVPIPLHCDNKAA